MYSGRYRLSKVKAFKPKVGSFQCILFVYFEMNPQYDIVMSLLETPFSRRSESEKREILQYRPTHKIEINCPEKNATQKRTCCRTFQLSWYESHKWFCGSRCTNRLYCWPCLLLGNVKNVWNTTGYFDLKNISRSTKLHNDSKEHIKNLYGP